MKIKKYYKLYFSELIKSIKKAIGWREFIYLVVSLIVGATIYFLNSGLNAMKEEIFNFIAFSVAPAILLSILFIIYYSINTHAKLYSRKENEANLPSWKDIEIKEFEFPLTSGLGVGLEIISHKPKIENDSIVQEVHIDQVMPKLVRISRGDDSQSFPLDLSSLLPMMQGNTTFQKTNIIKNPEQLKRDKQAHNAISVAKWNEDVAWITMGKSGKETKIKLEENVAYSIEIEIRDAMIDPVGKMFYICKISCNLLYCMDNNGQKKVVLILENRYPPYEQN